MAEFIQCSGCGLKHTQRADAVCPRCGHRTLDLPQTNPFAPPAGRPAATQLVASGGRDWWQDPLPAYIVFAVCAVPALLGWILLSVGAEEAGAGSLLIAAALMAIVYLFASIWLVVEGFRMSVIMGIGGLLCGIVSIYVFFTCPARGLRYLVLAVVAAAIVSIPGFSKLDELEASSMSGAQENLDELQEIEEQWKIE